MDKKNPHDHHGPEKQHCDDYTPPGEYHDPRKDYGDCYPSPNGYLGPVDDPCYQGPVITPAHG